MYTRQGNFWDNTNGVRASDECRYALDGRIDLSLRKSVSRLPQYVDSLSTIRKLGKGVECYSKENIDTLDSKGELLITLMSSLAQEESRSISENTTWGQRKRFADGKVTMPFSHFLGYDRGEDGEPVVNEDQAKTVRFIYKQFLDGKSISAIARHLTQHGVPSPGGVKQWQSTTIESILTNEKYRGDALLQKTFTVDFLTKKMKKNEGEVQSFYVKGSHPAIVSGEVFELAQSELRRRRESGRRICSGSVFASKLVCGECGGIYGSKVWGSNTKYRKTIWQCNNKYGKKATRCTTPHLTDEQIKTAFIDMVNGMVESRTEIVAFYDDLLDKLTDVAALEEQKDSLESEAAAVNKELHDWIMENARRAMSKEIYDARFDELDGKLNAVKSKLEKVSDEILRRNTRRLSAQNVLRTVKEAGPIADFDEGLFGALVDTVTVHPDKMVFALKDGSERTVSR